jgi:hypothetical protein
MKYSYRGFAVALVLGSIGLASSVLAGPDQIAHRFSGSRCVEIGDATPSIYYYGSAAENDNASERDFYCPVTFEKSTQVDTTYRLDTDSIEWSAYVDDSSSSTDVSCVLKACMNDGSNCFTSNTHSSDWSNGVGLLEGSSVTALGGSSRYHVYLRCDIPGKVSSARSGIVSYVAQQE